MSYCKRIIDQDYKVQLALLAKALGDSNAAVAVLESNNDFPLTKAPNGKDSFLYNDLYKKLKEINPLLSDYEAQNQAIRLKAVTHSSLFKNWFGDWVNGQGSKIVDTNGEPKIVFGLGTNERFDLSKEVDNTASETNKTGTYTFSEIQLDPSQSGYFIRSFNPNIEETFNPDSDSVVKNDEQSGIIQVKNSSLVKTAIHTTKYSEHIRDEYPGDYDISLQELFNSKKLGSYSYSVKIPLRDFINYLGLNTKYRSLFQLIGTHKDPNGPSLLDGLVIVLDSNSNALFGADASRMHEEYRGKRAYYIDSDKGGELHINVDGKYQDGDADSVIWHELMHRMTVRRLQDLGTRLKFLTILNDYLQVHPDMRYNGEQGLEEFVANIWFDPETIENLKKIPSPRVKKSLWQEIKEFFQEIIRGYIPDDSLFAEASYELNALFDSVETEATNKKFGDHIGSLPEETSQIVKLIQYQRSWQGVSQEDINAEITDFLKGGARSSVKKLLDKVQIRQAELHVLGYDFNDSEPFSWSNYLGGIDLDIPITKENLNPNRFTKLTYYKVDPAEIVVPKLYRSAFKLGGRHLSEINAGYFNKVNSYYKSKFSDPIDFIIRTHTGNISVIIQDSLRIPGLKIVNPEIKDGWRVTPKGDRMYKLPDDINDYLIYKDVYGNELIVFKDNNRALKNVKRLMGSTENLVSIQPILQNVLDPESWLEISLDIKSPIKTFDHELYNILHHSQDIKQDLLNLYESGELRYLSDLSNSLYNSFVKTLYMMSVRIPTLAFLSIMAAKIAELTDDTENAIFVTRWQFWLLGSDLDIDKSYLMGVDISPIGLYSHWSPLADYTTEKLTQISDTLPVPNGKIYTLPLDHFKKHGNIIDVTSGVNGELKTYITNYYIACEQRNKENELQAISDILNYLEKRDNFIIDPGTTQSVYFGRLLRNLNRHNSYKVPEGAIKNVIQSKIFQVSLDERNMKPGYSPIDEAVDLFKNLIKDIKTPGSDTRSLDDGLSKYRLQYANSVGKLDVGVMANGLKMFLALTQYFNRFRKQDALNAMSDSTRRFLIRLNLKTGEKYFGKLSDIQFEKEAIKAFSAYASLISGKVIEVENRMDDATQLLSGLISLAVDNAKELALDRLNAALDLACMHLYLVSLGCTAEEVVDAVTKNPAFAALAKDLLNQSKLIPSRKVLSTWFNPTQRELEKGWDKNQIEGYDLLKFLYHAALEFTAGARLLGINQGVLNDEFEIERKFDNFASLISSQVENLGLSIELSMYPYNFRLAEPMLAVIRAKTNLTDINPEYLQYTQQKWDALMEENVENKYLKADLKVDLNKYYKDSAYKDFIIRFYDFFKTTYNLYEMIDSLPHYNKMLEAFVNAENIITKSNRANWLMKQSKDAYNTHRITNTKLKTFGDSEYSYREEVFSLKPFGDSVLKKANRFYDMQILKTFLSENHENYRFSYKDADGNVQVIDPKNNDNLKRLADFVVFNLIPDLKDLYPLNKFLQFLRPDYKKASKSKDTEIYLPKYMFNFDVDKLHSVSDENKLYYINSGFNEIGNLTLNDIYDDIIEGGNLKVADLIMLNDRVTSMSSYGQTSLDKAFNLYSLENKNTIPVQIAKIIQELDLGIRPELRLDPVEFLAYCYQNQIRRNFDGIMQYDYDRETKTQQEYSIRNQYLIGFDENTILHNKEVRDVENLIKLLQAEKFTVEIRPYLEGYGQFLMFGNKPLVKIKTGWSVDEVSDISFEELMRAIKNNIYGDPEFKTMFEDEMDKALSEIESPHLESFETLNAYKKMVQRMNLLGVPVIITNDIENGKVENGIVYLNPNSDVTATPLHELMHLVFAVMKSDNYQDFEKLIKLMLKSEDFMDIFHRIDASPEYSDYMENDKMEEALCRLIESIASDQYDVSNMTDEYGEELETKLSKYINPYIGRTFGTPEPNSFITFLSAMISELPAYNSSIFIKPKKDTTGYMLQRVKVIQLAQITNWVKDNLVNKLLLEVEC